MAETKFTPGPWESFNRDTCQVIYAKGYERAICQVDSYSKGFGPDRDERDANAHLISAAPELYEALKGAIGALEYSVDCARDGGNNEDIDFAQSKLDAALLVLATARGEDA